MRTLRPAVPADIPRLATLIEVSARALGAGDYAPEVIDAALRGAFGVDTQLIADGTYFIVEEAGELAGCGGWSRRRTLFGADTRPDRDDALLDPARDAARIRAFFVAPAFARRGIGRTLLTACEAAARAHGFRTFELMATLTGVALYQTGGYVAGAPLVHNLAPGLSITFVPMRKAGDTAVA